jgi:hypothetical protein
MAQFDNRSGADLPGRAHQFDRELIRNIDGFNKDPLAAFQRAEYSMSSLANFA